MITPAYSENVYHLEIRLFALCGACGGFNVCLYVGNKQTHTGEYKRFIIQSLYTIGYYNRP